MAKTRDPLELPIPGHTEFETPCPLEGTKEDRAKWAREANKHSDREELRIKTAMYQRAAGLMQHYAIDGSKPGCLIELLEEILKNGHLKLWSSSNKKIAKPGHPLVWSEPVLAFLWCEVEIAVKSETVPSKAAAYRALAKTYPWQKILHFEKTDDVDLGTDKANQLRKRYEDACKTVTVRAFLTSEVSEYTLEDFRADHFEIIKILFPSEAPA